jgi:type II secretory pathway component PulC
LHLESERRDARADATADARARLLMTRTRQAPLPAAKHTAPRNEETVVVDISRSALHRLSVTPSDESQARLIPIVRMGSPVGVRISDIRHDGLFATLGLENGDSLMAVNDVPVTSPMVTDLRDITTLPDVLDLSVRRGAERLRIIALVHD